MKEVKTVDRYAKHVRQQYSTEPYEPNTHYRRDFCNEINQRDMLQKIVSLQSRMGGTDFMPVIMNKTVLCGVIVRRNDNLTWFDFDVTTCKLVNGRPLGSTDTIAIRNAIHSGGIYPLRNDATISIRHARHYVCRNGR